MVFFFQCSYLIFKVLNVQRLERSCREAPCPRAYRHVDGRGARPAQPHPRVDVLQFLASAWPVNLGWNLCSAFSFSLSSCRTISKFLLRNSENTDALECLKRYLFCIWLYFVPVFPVLFT